jgi:hypothetical protein
MIATFIFCKYLSRDQTYNLDCFFKRCAVKSSTKTVRTNPFWLVLIVSFIFNMNSSHDDQCPTVLDIWKTFFCFAIGSYSYSFCRTFDDASSKKNQDIIISSSRDILKIKIKVFQIFNMVGHCTIMWPIHFEYRRHYQNKSKGICSYSFCRAFHSASCKKRIKIIRLISAEVFTKNKCCNHYAAPDIFD